MKKILLAVLLALPAIARAADGVYPENAAHPNKGIVDKSVGGRSLASCDTAWGVEAWTVATTTQEVVAVPIPTGTKTTEGDVQNSSGTYTSGIKHLEIRNDDATSTNLVYVSSFPTTNVLNGWPIPGGNTEGSVAKWDWVGRALRFWVFRASGSGTVHARFCE